MKIVSEISGLNSLYEQSILLVILDFLLLGKCHRTSKQLFFKILSAAKIFSI